MKFFVFFFTKCQFSSKMYFKRREEQCVPCSPAAECITHRLVHAPLSDTEYINILDVLYFKLVRMFQSFLIKVTLCCFFLPLGKQRAFLCFCPWICARVIVPATQRGPEYSFRQQGGPLCFHSEAQSLVLRLRLKLGWGCLGLGIKIVTVRDDVMSVPFLIHFLELSHYCDMFRTEKAKVLLSIQMSKQRMATCSLIYRSIGTQIRIVKANNNNNKASFEKPKVHNNQSRAGVSLQCRLERIQCCCLHAKTKGTGMFKKTRCIAKDQMLEPYTTARTPTSGRIPLNTLKPGFFFKSLIF